MIRRVDLEQIIDLRQAVLRQGLPRQAAYFEGDRADGARHYGAFDDGQLVGCATVHLNTWEGRPAWQLRGMAITPTHQFRGIGREILAFVETDLAATPVHQLWCNARVPAAPFYQKLGWTIVSAPFEIPTAGPHVKMTRRLSSTSNPAE
jgi:GNAT superfamily N-acetyltransferase